LEGKKQSRRARYKLHKEIAELQHALTKERKLKEKYKKRLQRLAKNNESPKSKVCELVKNCPVNNRIRKTLLLHEALISDIKRKYQNARNERDKQILAKVTVGKIVKKYRLQRWSEQAFGVFKETQKPFEDQKPGQFYQKDCQQVCRYIHSEEHKELFNRDDVSRITTARKQTITRNKVKMQKRFLVDTMRNLHRKFLSENNVRISYPSFCRLRPFWVVHPSLSDRETCQCKLHENLSFLAEKLYQLKLIETSDLERLTKTVSCDTTRKDCMYGECENCKDKTVPLSSMYDSGKKASYTQWGTEEKAKMDDQEGPKVKISVKQIVEGTQEQLAEQFHTHLSKFKKHSFNIRQQYAYYRELRKSMATDECLIHIDFFRRTSPASTVLKYKQCTLDHLINRRHYIQGFFVKAVRKNRPASAQYLHQSTKAQQLFGSI